MLMEPFYDAGYDCFWHNPASRAYQDWYLDGVKWMVDNVGMCGVKLDGTWDPRLTTNELTGTDGPATGASTAPTPSLH
jgi:hypothetical protein